MTELESTLVGPVIDSLLKAQPRTIPRRLPTGSLVYLLGNAATTLVKIGMTDSLHRRVAELENASGVPLHVLGTIRCADSREAARVEQSFHIKFRAQRGVGEWFVYSPEILAEFEEWNG